ncbi:MAG: hypothetical protein IPH43_09075 [Xanthomonadales bacterium]|nr:hypothetical protein [Xanthomonadales bacterium]
MSTFGAGSQIASNNWVAEDFTVPAQGWSISQVRFYTYQTGSGTTSTINDLRIQVFSGTPGGTLVWGDTTTNRISSTTFARLSVGTLTNADRPVKWWPRSPHRSTTPDLLDRLSLVEPPHPVHGGAHLRPLWRYKHWAGCPFILEGMPLSRFLCRVSQRNQVVDFPAAGVSPAGFHWPRKIPVGGSSLWLGPVA